MPGPLTPGKLPKDQATLSKVTSGSLGGEAPQSDLDPPLEKHIPRLQRVQHDCCTYEAVRKLPFSLMQMKAAHALTPVHVCALRSQELQGHTRSRGNNRATCHRCTLVPTQSQCVSVEAV